MLMFYVFCCIVHIPHIFGNSLTSETSVLKFSKNVFNESQYEDYNKTKLNLVSEGGSLLPNAAIDIVPLLKDKHSILLNLDNEMGKNKEKSVVARKGVVYTSSEDTQIPQNVTKLIKSNMSTAYKGSDSSEEKKEIKLKNNTVSLLKHKITGSSVSQEINEEDKIKTVVPKKPLILSNEALDQITIKDSDIVYPRDSHNSKVTRNPNSHPGMIMPIVITILVVPMFAVIGYLAIKRGQEAWKNRHYKRMDFLLDGMYND